MPPIYIYTLFSIITYIWIDYYIYGPYIMYVRRRFALPCNVCDISCSTYNIYIYMPPIYIYIILHYYIYIWIHYYMYALHIMYVRRRFALPCSAVTLGVQLTIYIYHEYIYASNLYIHYSPLLYIYGSTIICMLYV